MKKIIFFMVFLIANNNFTMEQPALSAEEYLKQSEWYNQQLLQAAKANSLSTCKELLDMNALPFVTDMYNKNAFDYASDRSNAAMVNALTLRISTLIASLEESFHRCFMRAAEMNDITGIEMLMKSHAPKNFKKRAIRASLEVAYERNHVSLTKMITNKYGDYIKHPCRPATFAFAIQNGFMDVVKTTLEHPLADPFEKIDGTTLLAYAQKSSKPEMISIIQAAQKEYELKLRSENLALKDDIRKLKVNR